MEHRRVIPFTQDLDRPFSWKTWLLALDIDLKKVWNFGTMGCKKGNFKTDSKIHIEIQRTSKSQNKANIWLEDLHYPISRLTIKLQ